MLSFDANGDGYPDVASGSEVLINPGSGDFSNAVSRPFWDAAAQLGTVPVLLASLDADNDRDEDLIVSTSGETLRAA